MPKTIAVNLDDLIFLLDAYAATMSQNKIEDWLDETGNEERELEAAEQRLRKAAGKS